jgi:hypothetical protein
MLAALCIIAGLNTIMTVIILLLVWYLYSVVQQLVQLSGVGVFGVG